ncbi:MAG: hypothetical protein ABIK15_14585 [Pseudomonadota bacterium]
MNINALARKVLSTVGPVGGSLKVDKEAMGELLTLAQYRKQEERELVLFCKSGADGKDRILVLDNDLTIYHTSLNDVLLRKNPTVKEMISIRNAIKILNDKDVVVSRKEKSVQEIEKEAISFLDLSFTQQDIEEMEWSGRMAVEQKNAREIQQGIELFSELLGYHDAPGWLRLGGYVVRGGAADRKNRLSAFGPVLIYNPHEESLLLVNDHIESHEKEKVEWIRKVASGQEKADREGAAVFEFLKQAVVFRHLHPHAQESG